MDNTKNRGFDKKEVKTYTDYNIFSGNVRLIRDGMPPLVIDRDKAIELAKQKGMNLVQIAYNKNDFPRSVCKIMDYSRFKYEQKKREKEIKKKQREATAEIKEIKFSIRIDEGDLNTKINKIRELLEDGDKVKLTIRMSRREMQRTDLARDTLGSVLKKIADVTEMDQHPSLAGNLLYCVVRKRK